MMEASGGGVTIIFLAMLGVLFVFWYGASLGGSKTRKRLLFEEQRQQMPTTKPRMHPSCKAVASVQRCWWRRESKSPERGGTPTAKLGMPFNRHGFMTN